jgi:hypothetical protein
LFTYVQCIIVGILKDVGSTGIQQYFNAGIATSLLIKARMNPLKVNTAWLARLAVPDSIIFNINVGLKGAKLVLDANEFGIIVWPVRARVANGQRSYKIDLSEDTTVEYLHIHSLKDWCCQPLDQVAPAGCKELLPDGRPVGIRHVVTSTSSTGFLHFSADHCFPLMRVIEMQ